MFSTSTHLLLNSEYSLESELTMKKSVLMIFMTMLTAVLLLLEACSGKPNNEVKSQTYHQITQDEARQMMEKDDGHILVDVRRQDEYDAGHIPGAILIPNESIGTDQPKELPDLEQIILIYCRSGNRSKQASQKLADMGYTNIYEFGGIIDWEGDVVTSEQEEDSSSTQQETDENITEKDSRSENADLSVSGEEALETDKDSDQEKKPSAKLLYMGHASIRITTSEGKVIYIDPYAGDGYDPAADLILVTHAHRDHNVVDKVTNRSQYCRVITWKEALAGSEHQTFDFGYVRVEAVEAGYNDNHSKDECVGYVLTFSDGVSVYVSGDTSKTEQMPQLAEKNIDYAFFCCDGVYNMDLKEAAECAALVQAKHNIPYHVIPAANGVFFDRERAEQFPSENLLIIDEGEEIELVK